MSAFLSIKVFSSLNRQQLYFYWPIILFFIYLTLNGIERFLIEKIRVNEKYDFLGGITQAEIISFSLILIGILGCVFLIRNNQKTKSL